MLVRVLLVVDTPALESRLDRMFESLDIAIAAAPRSAVVWEQVKAFPADLVVIGRASLPDPMDVAIRTIHDLPERPEVIVLTEDEDADERARLLVAGCTAVLNTSLDDATLRAAFHAFVTRHRETSIQRLQHVLDTPRAQLSDFDSASATMQSFLRIVKRVVRPDSSLLIQGETGVGKERLARAIHASSPRASGPFVPVILSAFPEALIEAELFGHEAGAYTGAVRARRGCFELAHGGTIFLDEIGELPQHLQVKLLRVLQERQIRRLGAESSMDIDVRVMAATNRDLQQEIESGTFRSDLYYRLSVVTLDIPPLRDHAEDVQKLTDRYLEHFRVRIGARVDSFSQEAMEAMTRYPWPGNIRELINVVERSVLLSEGRQVTIDDLPRTIVPAPRGRGDAGSSSALDILFSGDWRARPWKDVRDAVVSACEQTYFVDQLQHTNGNIDETAQRAGLNPRSLYDLMKRHGLKKEDYRA